MVELIFERLDERLDDLRFRLFVERLVFLLRDRTKCVFFGDLRLDLHRASLLDLLISFTVFGVPLLIRLSGLQYGKFLLLIVFLPHDLILPLFVCEGNNIVDPILSMPGVNRYSIDKILIKVEEAVKLSVPAIAIFPQIDSSLKNSEGSLAIDENNLVCRSIKSIKKDFPEIDPESISFVLIKESILTKSGKDLYNLNYLDAAD